MLEQAVALAKAGNKAVFSEAAVDVSSGVDETKAFRRIADNLYMRIK